MREIIRREFFIEYLFARKQNETPMHTGNGKHYTEAPLSRLAQIIYVEISPQLVEPLDIPFAGTISWAEIRSLHQAPLL